MCDYLTQIIWFVWKIFRKFSSKLTFSNNRLFGLTRRLKKGTKWKLEFFLLISKSAIADQNDFELICQTYYVFIRVSLKSSKTMSWALSCLIPSILLIRFHWKSFQVKEIFRVRSFVESIGTLQWLESSLPLWPVHLSSEQLVSSLKNSRGEPSKRFQTVHELIYSNWTQSGYPAERCSEMVFGWCYEIVLWSFVKCW